MYLVTRESGYPVLFLHGIPTSCVLWNGVTERLSSQFQCIAVDLPGLGKSASTPHDFRNLTDLAASIEAIRIDRGIEKWHVVGHDAGCAIAVHYVHQFPHRVGRIALLSPSMFPELKPFFRGAAEAGDRRISGAYNQPAVLEHCDVGWRG